MVIDDDKVDKAVLALLWLARCGEGRAWKSHDWDAMDRLFAKGVIGDPKSKAKGPGGERAAVQQALREGWVETKRRYWPRIAHAWPIACLREAARGLPIREHPARLRVGRAA
jgi:hypothetical protein